MLEDPEDPVWPTRCRVTVRGLPPGVSAKEFYTKLDASVFCRVLMDGTPQKTHMDRQRDTWACELEFNVAPLMWMDPRLMALPEVPMYSALEFGTPTAYLILLCWRHVPFLFHLHSSFHHAVVGPGPGDVTHFARLADCVTSFCERRLDMYRERQQRLVVQREEEVANHQLRVRFYEYMQVLWQEDKDLLMDWFFSFSSFQKCAAVILFLQVRGAGVAAPPLGGTRRRGVGPCHVRGLSPFLPSGGARQAAAGAGRVAAGAGQQGHGPVEGGPAARHALAGGGVEQARVAVKGFSGLFSMLGTLVRRGELGLVRDPAHLRQQLGGKRHPAGLSHGPSKLAHRRWRAREVVLLGQRVSLRACLS